MRNPIWVSLGLKSIGKAKVFFGDSKESFASLLFSASRIPGGSDGKVSAYNAGDLGSIPGLERSPGEGNSNPFQYSCLENPMDSGTWQATIHRVAKTQT